MRRLLVLAALCFTLAVISTADAQANPVIYGLSPDGSTPKLHYEITAYDGVSEARTYAYVEAVAGAVTVETVGILNPKAQVTAMNITYPAATFDLTIGTAELPFTFSMDAFTETLSGLVAVFPLGTDGIFSSTIGSNPLSRDPFAISIESGGATLNSVGGADCGGGCIGGTLSASVNSLQVDQLTLAAGTKSLQIPEFGLGSDPLGITWSVRLSASYGSSNFPLVFVPEPATALFLACGLAGLAAAGRRRQ